MAEDADDLLVGRLWSWTPERLVKDAEIDRLDQLAHDRPNPDYSVSVFALPLSEQSDLDATEAKLIDHIKSLRDSRWIGFARRSELEAAGLVMRLNEPPPHHYDVILGTELDMTNVEKLSEVFNRRERRRFR